MDIANAPTQVLLVLLLVGATGTFMLHPVAFPSEYRLSTSAYNFICVWSFFVGNMLFLLRSLAQEIGADYVKHFDAYHIILIAQSIYLIGSFGALAAFYSEDSSINNVPTEVGVARKKPAKGKQTPVKRKRSSSRKKRK